MKEVRCWNCKEQVREELLMKVRQKGEVRLWCDSCFIGYQISKEEDDSLKEKSIIR